MKVRLVHLVLIAWLALDFGVVFAHGQSDFDKAHALLQQLVNDRVSRANSSEGRIRLAEELRSGLAQVDKLLATAILSSLNSGAPPSIEQLQREIKTALQIGAAEPGNNAEVFVFPVGVPPEQSYIVGYNIPFCAICTRSWIGAIGPDAGRYEIVTTDHNPLPNQSLTAFPLWIGPGQIQFLVYGTLWGDPHNRLNALGYSFDGRRLERIWSRTDLPQGAIEVRPGTVVLSFLTALQKPAKQRQEIYTVTTKGIKLQDTSEHNVK